MSGSQARLRQVEPRRMPSPTIIAFGFMLLLTLAGLSWLGYAMSDPAALPIRKVMVEGEFNHLDPDHLQVVVVDAVNAGFFGVDVADIRRILLQEPWIRDATIRRVWPDALRVSIEEQMPVARWGEYALLNEEADIFAPETHEIPEGLVRLSGPLGTESEVLSRYHFVARRLSEIGLAPAGIALSERHAWTVTTANGRSIVLGRQDLELRLARFIFGYRHGLHALWERIGRIDLRYTNGFAVAESRVEDSNG